MTHITSNFYSNHITRNFHHIQHEERVLYSLNGRTSHSKFSRCFKAARFDVKIIASFQNLAGISAALLPRWISLTQTSRHDQVLRQDVHSPLKWRHDERDGVSNYQPHDCLLNCLLKARIKESIKAQLHWPLCGEFTGDRWILRTKGQWHRKYLHLMTSSCLSE